MNRLAEKLGDRLPGTTADFQDMMTMLQRQGMSAKSVLGGLGEATAYLGVQLKMAPTEAAEFTAKLQDATRTSEKDMMGLVDMIQRGFYAGVDSGNMLEAYKGLGAAMDMIKVKGLEGAKAFAPFVVMMDQAGMRGESAGNAIRKVIAAGLNVDKIKKVEKSLLKKKKISLGLDFTNGKGEFGGLDNLMKQLAKLQKLDTVNRLAVLKDIFGDDKETNEVLSKIIEKGQGGYDDVVKNLAEQASLQERVNQQLGTLKNLWDAASGTFTNAMVKFGESISPELKAAAEWIADLSEKTGAWARENPQLVATLMKIAAVVAVVLTALGGLLIAAAAVAGPFMLARFGLSMFMATLSSGLGVLGRVGPALMTVLKVVGFVGRMMMFTPIGLAITAIAAAATLIYLYWEPIKAFFADIWAEIVMAFSGGVAGIAALILNWSPLGLFYRAFAAVMGWFGVELPNRFTGFGSMIMQGLVSGIKSGLGWVKDAILGVGDMLPEWLRNKLDIHSPSRVFAGIGGYTMAGLEQGIVQNQGGPLAALRQATGKLTALGAGVMLGAGPALAGQLDTRPPLARPVMAAAAPS
ncbi:phage tail tape measure protein [Chromobacterium sp. Beijing]|uniref:phage tail tape measure protein n=1 Tax=Chromobacterium sp. Beijing TaxID=2735795 RepID=UPI00351D72F9